MPRPLRQDLERRAADRESVQALVGACRPHLRDDERDPPAVTISVGAEAATFDGGEGTLFHVLTGQDVLDKVTLLESTIRSLSQDIKGQVSRDSFHASWKAWSEARFKDFEKIRTKNWITLNLLATSLLSDCEQWTLQLARWREALLREGGKPSGVGLTVHAGSDTAEKANKPAGLSLGDAFKWIGIIGTLFGAGYALNAVTRATRGVNLGSFVKGAVFPSTSPSLSRSSRSHRGDLQAARRAVASGASLESDEPRIGEASVLSREIGRGLSFPERADALLPPYDDPWSLDGGLPPASSYSSNAPWSTSSSYRDPTGTPGGWSPRSLPPAESARHSPGSSLGPGHPGHSVGRNRDPWYGRR
jgi:hypothetical protein